MNFLYDVEQQNTLAESGNNLKKLFGIKSKKDIRKEAMRNYLIIGAVAVLGIFLMRKK